MKTKKKKKRHVLGVGFPIEVVHSYDAPTISLIVAVQLAASKAEVAKLKKPGEGYGLDQWRLVLEQA